MEARGLTNWRDYFEDWPDNPQKARRLRSNRRWELPAELHYTRWTGERTIAQIDRAVEQDRPFFIWSSFHDPHPPYICPEPWVSMYDPAEIPRLLEPLEAGRADVVFGSRFLGSTRGMKWMHRLANRILTLTTNVLYGAGITDEATGYKLFRRSVLDGVQLRCNRFEFCPEVTAKILKKGHAIHELPLGSYVARHLDKKISWTDGFAAFWVLIRERLRD